VPNAATALNGSVRLETADLDNNGAVDLLLTTTETAGPNETLLWLGNPDGSYSLMDHPADVERVFAAADVIIPAVSICWGLMPGASR